MNKPPHIQIRLFTAKENKDLKKVAYVNCTLNELKESVEVLVNFKIVGNYKPQ